MLTIEKMSPEERGACATLAAQVVGPCFARPNTKNLLTWRI